MNKELPEETQNTLRVEAESYAGELGYMPYGLKWSVSTVSYMAAATKYHALYLESERKRKEAMELLEPILDWGQGNPDLALGTSITAEVLRRAKAYKIATDALEAIQALPGYRHDECSQVASQALAQLKEGGENG